MEINLTDDAIKKAGGVERLTIKIGRKKFNLVNIGGKLFINKIGNNPLIIELSSETSITLK